MKRRVALARQLYGEHDPLLIEGVLTDAGENIYTQNFAVANRELRGSDVLPGEAHLDQSALQAE